MERSISKHLIVALLAVAAVTAVACGGSAPTSDPTHSDSTPARRPMATPEYWPTDGWKTSTPAQQGMDSALLSAMLDEVRRLDPGLYSVLVVRNGYLVVEDYFRGDDRNTPHAILSTTKSITSALIGITIQQGHIASVDALVSDFFADKQAGNPAPRKQAMTLRHLLTMTSGVHWPKRGVPNEDSANAVNQMFRSPDWVQFVLDRPMAADPGAEFNYDSGGSHLLSAIIQRSTGLTSLTFATRHLFEPLGISNMRWTVDPAGINIGGFGINMTPRDMAKFGYLYLNNGVWEGTQLVDAAWVGESTKEQSRGPSGAYGYHWRVGPNRYAAVGLGGKRIIVLPAQAMVVVFTGELSDADDLAMIDYLLDTYIIRAAGVGPAPQEPLDDNL